MPSHQLIKYEFTDQLVNPFHQEALPGYWEATLQDMVHRMPLDAKAVNLRYQFRPDSWGGTVHLDIVVDGQNLLSLQKVPSRDHPDQQREAMVKEVIGLLMRLSLERLRSWTAPPPLSQ